MRNPIILSVVLAAGCSFGGDAPARTKSAAGQPQITAVAGIEWGLPSDSIVARRGEPDSRAEVGREVEGLAYRETLIGVPVDLLYLVHRRHGMIRGGYGLPISSAEGCVDALHLIDRGLSERYPELEPIVQLNAGAEPCTTVLAGKGTYSKVWTDPVNDARIALLLAPPGSRVTLLYTTPEADEWESQKNESQF